MKNYFDKFYFGDEFCCYLFKQLAPLRSGGISIAKRQSKPKS